MLTHVPADDWAGIDTFVLRQSTRKQRRDNPVWGRMFYLADLGLPGQPAIGIGGAIMLEAIDCRSKIEWSDQLDDDDREELERLRSDGHSVTPVEGGYILAPVPGAVRATQLYRTLLHEIGHWVDYLEKVERPELRGDGSYHDLSDAYFQRSHDEREAFAHHYANGMRQSLRDRGVIPFEQGSRKPCSIIG